METPGFPVSSIKSVLLSAAVYIRPTAHREEFSFFFFFKIKVLKTNKVGGGGERKASTLYRNGVLFEYSRRVY